MAYSKTNWQDLPSTTTPLNATNLNKIENELESLENNKVAKSGDTMTGTLVTEENLSTGGKTSANDGKTGTYIGKGNIELSMGTPFIDFHFDNNTSDYTSRIIESERGVLNSVGEFKIKGKEPVIVHEGESADSTTKTYTLKHGHFYLVLTGHSLSNSASMHLISAHNTYGRVNTVLANNDVNVTIDKLQLTITTTSNCNIRIIDCG